MRLYDQLKYFIKQHSTYSNDLVGANAVKKNSTILNIQNKFNFSASDMCSNQETINTIVKQIIKKDKSRRYYIGKKNENIKKVNRKVYRYECFFTRKIRIVPNAKNSFDFYIENIHLGQIPEDLNIDIKNHLETGIMTTFAYINGGPYKYYDKNSQSVCEEDEAFDLNIYIQFSR